MKTRSYCILILVIIGIMVGLTEFALATTVITFNFGNNWNEIPQHYAEEANIDLKYWTVAGMGSTTPIYPLLRWGPGYSNLSNVAFARYDGLTGEIIFTPVPGYSVTINSLDVGFWPSNPEPQYVRIYDFYQTTIPLWSSGPLNYSSTHLSLNPHLIYNGAIRLQFGTNYNFGITNISYTVEESAVIPEPGTFLLLGFGLLGLAGLGRKKILKK